ncbi:MAG: hypothetical protein O3B84_03850, partial [Chloroflexi bacterium]|nr:hypothetical protein [Chloroflexota bacterium]
MWLITFDIDGTMEFGDPNGILTREHVRYFRARGALIGSASDRPETTQWMLWRTYGEEPDFVILKHRMLDLRDRYPEAETYWHVGDRPLDQQNAKIAGFTFFWPDQFPSPEIAADFFSDPNEEGVEDYDTHEQAAIKLASHALGNGHDPEQVPRILGSGISGMDLGN